MTNFEYFKNDIQALDYDIALTRDNQINRCKSIDHCIVCIFSKETHGSCAADKIAWLYEEHKEAPKLTKNAHEVLERLNLNYIAKDKSGAVYGYTERPIRNATTWDNSRGILVKLVSNKGLCLIEGETFDFVKWEDEEPWSHEDLLKLEVIE